MGSGPLAPLYEVRLRTANKRLAYETAKRLASYDFKVTMPRLVKRPWWRRLWKLR